MKNSQLAEILRSLDRDEFRGFGKFVRSPYFNNRSEVVRFFDAVKKFYPDFVSEDFNEEKIFIKVYPDKKFSGVMFRKLVSLLTNLLMDFYAVLSQQENTLDYNVKLLYKLYEKGLADAFKKKAKHMETLLENSKHTPEYYESKFKYTSKKNAYLNDLKNESVHTLYQKEMDDYIEYFLAVALILYHRLGTYSNVYNIKYDLKFYKEIFTFLESYDYKDLTLVNMYYNMTKIDETKEEKYFIELLNFWERSKDNLNDIFLYNVFISLYNFCINKRNNGDSQFIKKQFEITKKYLTKDTLTNESIYISPILFSGIVRTAACLKEFNWIEDFIKKYRSKLNPEMENETMHYCNGMIEFEKRNFEKSLVHLSKINPKNISWKLNVKNLLIMNNYELGHYEELILQMDAYKHFLHRDTEAGESLKKRDSNIIMFVSELVKIKLNGKNESAFLLKNEIEKTPYFSLKEWVIAKADELCK
ncbi:MAG: hypothetical protein IPM38_15595 [Ignavibacteria bacterium]|nr:hypothetical protein [Ignavibacteria bacterium]